jgi:hypothetical protein
LGWKDPERGFPFGSRCAHHRNDVHRGGRREDIPVPFRLFRSHDLAIVAEDHVRADVAHVEGEPRRVLVLGEVMGCEAISFHSVVFAIPELASGRRRGTICVRPCFSKSR